MTDPQQKGASESTDSEAARLCPSARCEPGSLLIGVVGKDGSVGHLPTALEVDSDFVDLASTGSRPAEERFRFASSCVRGRCQQWRGDRCGVADDAADELVTLGVARLPRCSIRRDCRWFHQRGAAACRVCTYVVTDG